MGGLYASMYTYNERLSVRIILKVAFYFFFLLAFQYLPRELNNVRWLLCSWMIFCVVLSNYYNCIFYSILTIAIHEDPIDTVSDLVNSIEYDQYQVFTYKDSSFLEQFIHPEKENELFNSIGANINRF